MNTNVRSAAIEAFWLALRQARGVAPDQRCDVFAFGDSAATADELLALVLAGPKRATAALVLDFERSGDPLPERGSYSLVLDGHGAPGCVIRTTAVEVRPFDQVDTGFAWDEGEDGRTLEAWRDGNRRYVTRQCAGWDTAFDERMPVVLERFALVWPEQPAVS
jgi:uncharacterized protein YhfF